MNTDFPIRACTSGEFHQRANLLWKRLHETDHYGINSIFRPKDYGWPGDSEGRCLLAWTLLGRLLGETSPALEEFFRHLPGFLNENGCFGTVCLPETADEQQFSGHGWVLRALSEQYRDSGNETVRAYAENILRNLALPATRFYKEYPLHETRSHGEASGRHDRRSGNWLLSTDIACAFIFTDGVIQAQEVFGVNCSELIETMIDTFARIDLLQVMAQTHASLTMTRGLLRWHALTGDENALAVAKKVFELYRHHGMTEHYANFNWFLRRDTWTEPCAIVDSFQAALALFRATGDETFLDDAHRIWFTAFSRAQRPNGGMGLDTCPTADAAPMLKSYCPEAWWCCTMRGAEGFHECGMRGMWRHENALDIAMPIPGIYEFSDGFRMELHTGYPYDKNWRISVLNPGQNPPEKIRVYLTGCSWTNAEPRNCYELEKRPARYGNGLLLWRGPILTGTDSRGIRHDVCDLWKSLGMEESEKLELKITVPS